MTSIGKMVEKEHAMFRSDNLGNKMNQFMNIYLHRDGDRNTNQKYDKNIDRLGM